MPDTLKTILKKSLYTMGYYHIRRRLSITSDKLLLILMYHGLRPNDARSGNAAPDDDSPTPSQFDAHLRTLANHCRVVSLKDVIAEIRSGEGLETDSVAITFDDGFESVYSVAYPLLRKYNVPATVFLVTDWVGHEVSPWWHHLREMLRKADLSKVENEHLRTAFGPEAPALRPMGKSRAAGRNQFNRRMETVIRNIPQAARAEKLDALERLLFSQGGFNPAPVKMLTWDQIREMAGNRIEFGAHTRTHINLRFAEPYMVEKEIRESKLDIEARIQREVTGFAYPYGKDLASYAPYEQFLRLQGFAYACNACSGSNSAGSNHFSLYRASLPLAESPAIIHRDIILQSIRDDHV